VRKIDLYSDVLPKPLFRRLVGAVREVGTERLKDSYRTNFWFRLGSGPRNIVEEIIERLRPWCGPARAASASSGGWAGSPTVARCRCTSIAT